MSLEEVVGELEQLHEWHSQRATELHADLEKQNASPERASTEAIKAYAVQCSWCLALNAAKEILSEAIARLSTEEGAS